MTLIEMLLAKGYPKSDIDHRESDLYIYDTPLTREVLKEFCVSNGWNNIAESLKYKKVNEFVLSTFKDNLTGRAMFDCFGQYYDFE